MSYFHSQDFVVFVFFFNDTATTEIYPYRHTLSLHDALPIFERSAGFPRRLEARQHLDPDRPIGKAVAEIAVMLLGEQGGWHQHRHLLASIGGDEGGAHRDFGLAESDIAADHAIHRRRPVEIANHPDRQRGGWGKREEDRLNP